MKRNGRQTANVEEMFSRRSLLDWMGKATVIGLTGSAVAACVYDDGALGDTENGSDKGAGKCGDGNFPFEPGSRSLEVFRKWDERTVDPQDLKQILKKWKLTVGGMVEKPFTLGFAELLALKRQDQTVDFHCVEGWSIHDVPWNGVHLKTLFEMAKVKESATHVTFHTVENIYNESLRLEEALEPKTLLAYGIGCTTLPLRHGFPLRVVVPRKYAYKSPKYVYRIELTDHPIDGYWVRNGYPYDGDVPKNRLRPGKY